MSIPGEFLVTDLDQPDPQKFIEKFRQHMRTLQPKPTAHHSKVKIFTHKDLATCTHVFLRKDAVRKPLEPPYQGPYQIVRRINDSNYIIRTEAGESTINTERLKPAYTLLDDAELEDAEEENEPQRRNETSNTRPKTIFKTYPPKKKTVQFAT